MLHPRFLGVGIATSLGTGIAANLAALRQLPTPPQPVLRTLGEQQEAIPYKLLADFPLADTDTRLYRVVDEVIRQALAEAGLTAAQQQRLGLFIGSSSFDISVSEGRYHEEVRASRRTGHHAIPLRVSSSFGNFAAGIRERFGFRGADFSFNTACTASANALWYADRLIRAGQLDHALVLGVELINDITAFGFHGLDLLTRSVMKPFDSSRDGLVLGEAASALVLGRGDAGRFRLCGGANLCDTHSMSAANADGSTVAEVITQALAEAGIGFADLRAVKAHGTASLLNDEAEAAGLLRLASALPPVCAIKPFIGHTLGACGLTELLLFCAAAEQDFLIATPGIAADGALGITLNQQARAVAKGHYLMNYFGFGGNNTALVIARGDAA